MNVFLHELVDYVNGLIDLFHEMDFDFLFGCLETYFVFEIRIFIDKPFKRNGYICLEYVDDYI